MEFKIMKNASVDDMKYVLSLIRTGKLQASTVIRMLDPYEASKSEDENVSRYSVEIWRREGGIDMFHTPTNDVFDKITIKGIVEYPENPLINRVNFNLCFESFPVGFLSEDELEEINGTLLISNSVLNEKDLSSVVIDIINRYSNFGIYTISFGVNLNKYQKEINDMRYDQSLISLNV